MAKLRIFRYTDEIKDLFHLNVKPEPWLHCILYNVFDKNTYYSNTYIAIFVWDTRQIVYDAPVSDRCNDIRHSRGGYEIRYRTNPDSFREQCFRQLYFGKHPVAADNRKPLQGSAKYLEQLNNAIQSDDFNRLYQYHR